MSLQRLLRDDLAEARKANDTQLVALIRTLIAAIENAEAVDPAESDGATEVPRRRLATADITRIILEERDDLREAADEYDQRGHREEAERLRALSDVADRYSRTSDQER